MKKLIVRLLILICITLSVIIPTTVVSADSGNFSASSDETLSAGAYNLSGGSYFSVWDSLTGMDPSPSWLTCEQTYIEDGGVEPFKFWNIKRGYLYFDTSSIPDLATITSATLYLHDYGYTSTRNFNITITQGMPTYPHYPIQESDFYRGYYVNTSGGSINATSIITWNTWYGIPLNPTGLGWLNKTGQTKFCLRSSKDINCIAPITTEAVYFDTIEVGYSPYLSITWTPSAVPSVTTLVPTDVTMNSFSLHGVIDSDGGGVCTPSFFLITDNTHGHTGAYPNWDIGFTEPYYTGDYVHSGGIIAYYDAGGSHNIEPSTSYTVNFITYNSLGGGLDAGYTFTTPSTCAEPSSLDAIPSACSVNLSWYKGAGCYNTIIRYSESSCPTNISGDIAYNGSGSSFVHTGLEPGTTYYYNAFGFANGNYTANGSGCVMVTTLAGDCEGAGHISSDLPETNWFLMTNSSRMDNFFLSPMINGVFDGWSLPRDTGWLLLSIFLLVLTAFLLYLASHNLILCGLYMIVFISIFGFYQMLPLWFDIVFGISAAGVVVKGAMD